jgi:gamma-glutamylputrescine oxidase
MQEISFWEHDIFFRNIDFLIIGAGITGLHSAIQIKKKEPQARVLVLEKDFLPQGASLKNAGFACFGSPTELLDNLKNEDNKTVFELAAKRYSGLQKLRNLLGEQSIQYEACGSQEVFFEDSIAEETMDRLSFLNSELKLYTDLQDVFSAGKNQFSDSQVKHTIRNQYEGALHSGKMYARLLELCKELNIIIINGLGVQAINDDGKSILTDKGFEITCGQSIVCTNGFIKKLLPQLDISPGRGQVWVTKEIPNLTIKGIFHFNMGYTYFRNIGNRILIGGGRNLAYEEEKTSEFGSTEIIQNHLKDMLSKLLPKNSVYEIEHQWSGIMGFRNEKSPLVEKIAPHLFVAAGMGGMGVAISAHIGEEVAQLVFNN